MNRQRDTVQSTLPHALCYPRLALTHPASHSIAYLRKTYNIQTKTQMNTFQAYSLNCKSHLFGLLNCFRCFRRGKDSSYISSCFPQGGIGPLGNMGVQGVKGFQVSGVRSCFCGYAGPILFPCIMVFYHSSVCHHNLLMTNREVRELWETQDFQVRPVSVEDLVRG